MPLRPAAPAELEDALTRAKLVLADIERACHDAPDEGEGSGIIDLRKPLAEANNMIAYFAAQSAALDAEIAKLRAALGKAKGAMTGAAYTLRNIPVDNPRTIDAWKDAIELEQALAALKQANPDA